MKNLRFIILTLFLTTFSLAQIINVPADQLTIQAGIDAAENGDTVLVAEGTYFENINFKGKAITVASHFILNQDISHRSKTIINGGLPANPDSGSVVYFISGEDTTSVLKGFTITGGTGTKFSSPNAAITVHYGGGIFIGGIEGARIEWNIIIKNFVNSTFVAGGGGIASGNPGGPGYTIIENNVIRNNEVSGKDGDKEGCGIWMGNSGKIVKNDIADNSSHSINGRASGGVRLVSSGNIPISVFVSNNTIINNQAVSTQSYCFGGGVNSSYTNLVMTNNIVENNSLNGKTECYGAGIHIGNLTDRSKIEDNIIKANFMNEASDLYFAGGGIFIWESEISISKNTIISNYAGGSGGGIHLKGSNSQIKNNLIAFNGAGNDAGGIDFFDHSDAVVVNNTIVENYAKWGGALTAYGTANPTIMNTIIYGNHADSSGNQVVIGDEASDPTFLYCDIEGGKDNFGFYLENLTYSGAYKNNMNSNPLFSDDSLFYLATGSPCIDTGHPDPEYNDLDGTQNDMGWAGGPLVTSIKGIVGNTEQIPNGFRLSQNYPNPFNPSTTIKYQIPNLVRNDKSIVTLSQPASKTGGVEESFVTLKVYDILGREMVTIINQKQKPGNYEVIWDAFNQPSGVYFYQLTTEDYVETKKMILLR